VKRSEAAKLVALIQAAYPRNPWPDETVALLIDELAALELGQAAVTSAIRTMLRTRHSEFAPSLGEILGSIVEQLDVAPGFADAWREMESKASSGDYFHPDDPPLFTHPAIDRLARSIGWQTFTNSEPGDPFMRQRAERIYQAAVQDRRTLALGAPSRAAELLKGDVPDDIRELVSGIGEDDG
jgi:hypothetical protein